MDTISPIELLSPISRGARAAQPAAAEEGQGSFGQVFQSLFDSFGDAKQQVGDKKDSNVLGMIFGSAIENVRQTDADNVEAQYLLATGQLDNPSALMIASSKYQLSVNLLVQLRNKALDAYSELTRISL